MRHIHFFILFLLLSSATWAQDGKKSDAYDLPQIVAVENRMFNPASDISMYVGFLPLDAFYKAVTAGVSYTRAINDSYKWGIINAHIAFTSDTGLKKDLLTNFSVQPQGILDSIKYYVTSDLLYTPIYGKNLAFNQKVVRTEMSMLLSGGMVAFNSGDTAPMAGFGGQIRFFSSETFSYKFDTRVYYHMDAKKSSNFVLNIGFGLSFDNPGDKQDDKKL